MQPEPLRATSASHILRVDALDVALHEPGTEVWRLAGQVLHLRRPSIPKGVQAECHYGAN